MNGQEFLQEIKQALGKASIEAPSAKLVEDLTDDLVMAAHEWKDEQLPKLRTSDEAVLEIASVLGVRIVPGGLDSYARQENVEVREEDGHRYLHTRSVQPAGPVAHALYSALLRAVMAGYNTVAEQPVARRVMGIGPI